jgi:cobalt-zinc-cadmium efflux system protein
MSDGHDHTAGANPKSMWIALCLTGSFMLAEFIGGVLSSSLALISDAAHMLTDTAALGIGLFAIHMARRAADQRRTFGYARSEIIAAAFNAGMLFVVAIYILFEAYQRLRNPPEIQSSAMLIIAVLGLVVNLISMKVLSSGKDHNLNMKGAYLEVWSDMLGSLGVIGGALLIRFTGWTWVDPIIAVAIALWVLPRTLSLMRESVNVLLEGVPAGVDLSDIEKTIASSAGVRGVHDLHVWAITTGKSSLSAHVLLEPSADFDAVRIDVASQLEKKFNLHHSTLQCEREACEAGEECGITESHGEGHDHDSHLHAEH